MVHKVVGQGNLVEGFLLIHESVHAFDDMDSCLDWGDLDVILGEIYSKNQGRPSYPPLLMFKALLLAQWYGLSDYQLEAQLGRDLAFRRFCGLGLDDRVPDHSTICRFREQLLNHGVMDALFARVNTQLDDQGLIIKQGTLMDATIVESPRSHDQDGKKIDGFADETVKRDTNYHGYKIHVGMDQGSHLIRTLETTPASTHDSRVADRLLSGDERAGYGDKAYHSKKRLQAYRKLGLYYGILRKGKPRSLPKDEAIRAKRHRKIRAAVERVFAHIKRHMGYTTTRYIGIHKNRLHHQLLAIAYNLAHVPKLLATKA